MRPLRPFLTAAALAASLSACAGDVPPQLPIAAAAAVAESSTAPSTSVRPLYIHTGSPYSNCTVDLGGGSEIEVYANHKGVVKLMRGTDGADGVQAMPQSVTYACTNETGAVKSGSLTASDVFAGQSDWKAQHEALPADARTLPALTGDLTKIPQASLLARGYPPRPDGDSAAYADWVQIVSKAHTFIPPHPVPSSIRHSGPTQSTSRSWAGININADSFSNPFFSVFGYWIAPSAHPLLGSATVSLSQSTFPYTVVSLFPGIVDANYTTVVQSGLDVVSTSYQDWAGFYHFTWYYQVWNEWYPNSGVTLNLPVGVNDSMNFHTWVGDSGGNPSSNPSYAWAYIIDQTTNQVTVSSRLRPANAVFDGQVASWILEIPPCGPTNATLCPQTNYGTATITSNSFAQQWDHTVRQWWTDQAWTNQSIVKPDGSYATLTTTGDSSDPSGAYSLHFQWKQP